jgi:hypothetical protein
VVAEDRPQGVPVDVGPVPLGIGDPEDLRTGQLLLVRGREVAQRGGVVGEDQGGPRLLRLLDSADACGWRWTSLRRGACEDQRVVVGLMSSLSATDLVLMGFP